MVVSASSRGDAGVSGAECERVCWVGTRRVAGLKSNVNFFGGLLSRPEHVL